MITFTSIIFIQMKVIGIPSCMQLDLTRSHLHWRSEHVPLKRLQMPQPAEYVLRVDGDVVVCRISEY